MEKNTGMNMTIALFSMGILFIGLLLFTEIQNPSREGLQNHKGWTSQFRTFWRGKISRPFRKMLEEVKNYYTTHIIRPLKHRFG